MGCWVEQKCTNVCLPCCSHGRRRRWTGLRCGSCCHRVCVPVPRCRFWFERVCFTAEMIIKGLNGLLYTLFKPIMDIVQGAIELAMRPISTAISNALADKLLAPLNVLDGMRSISIDIMQIDGLSTVVPNPPSCAFLAEAARLR